MGIDNRFGYRNSLFKTVKLLHNLQKKISSRILRKYKLADPFFLTAACCTRRGFYIHTPQKFGPKNDYQSAIKMPIIS